MLVSQILTQKGDDVFACSPQDTIAAAAGRLHAHGIGAMVVMDEKDRVAGIISERDIVRAIANAGAQAQDAHEAAIGALKDRSLVLTTMKKGRR